VIAVSLDVRVNLAVASGMSRPYQILVVGFARGKKSRTAPGTRRRSGLP
jgi:hypothetical protein